MDGSICCDREIEDRNDPFMTFALVMSDAFWIYRVSVQRNSTIGKVYVNEIVSYSLTGAISEMIQETCDCRR